MENLQIFTKDEIGTIRTKQINGEIYFVGRDIADVLGYQNGSRDISRHMQWKKISCTGVLPAQVKAEDKGAAKIETLPPKWGEYVSQKIMSEHYGPKWLYCFKK